MARMAGPAALAPLLRKMPPGLVEARQRLSQLLDEVAASSGLPHSKVVLGGFSQGAMTAIDVALSQPAEKRVAGVLSLSGAPIVVDEWAKRCTVHPKLPVFVSHGRADPVLPFEGAGWLVDLLRGNGLEVHTEFHNEAHTVGPVLPQAFKWLSHR